MTGTMRMLPVVWRELGAIARRRSVYWIRSGVGLAAFLAMGWIALISLRAPLLDQGRSLFLILALGGFSFALVAGIRGTSDALSEEKREGTLGLLFLTDLKGYDVVFGKFVSLSINSMYGILTLVPLLAFAFLLGGISPNQFLLMSACLLNTLFFSLAVGIFVSTFNHHERPAMGGTLAIIFVLAGGPYAICAAHSYDSLEIWETLLPGFLIPSPVYAFYLAADANLSHFLRDEILLSLAFTHLAGWLCLVVASASIAARANQDASRGPILALLYNIRQRLAYGKAQHRRAIRAQTLNRNAFFWLAARDRLKGRYAWAFIGLLGTVWALARWKAPEVMTDWPVMLGMLWFVHLFFKVWIASEVSARFIEDRRSNALELLLTTSLPVRDFARGQFLALLRQFSGAISAVLALDLIAGYHAGGSFGYALQSNSPWQYFFAGILIFLADIYTMYWVAIWRSLHLRGANRTILQAIALVILIPVFGLFLLNQGSWLFTALFGAAPISSANLLWLWTILCLFYDAVLVAIAHNAFTRDFREVASHAFESPAQVAKAAKLKTPKLATRRRRFHPIRWATAAAIILICLASLATVRRHRFAAKVQQRFAAIRAEGLPVTPAEATVWRPIPPESQNATALLTKVDHSIAFRRTPYRPDLFDATAREMSLKFVGSNTAALALLEDLPNRKPVVRAIDSRPRTYFDAELIFQILEVKARLDLEANAPSAAHSISLFLHLARVLDGEGLGMGRGPSAALNIATELLERAAASRGFSVDQWREWQSILRQIDPMTKFATTLILFRVEGIEVFGWTPDELWSNFGRGSTPFASVYSASLAIRRFIGQDQREILEYLDIMDHALAESKRPFWEKRNRTFQYGWRAPNLSLAGSYMFLPHLLPATDWMQRAAFNRLTRLRLMQLAADIEIYRAQHATLPRQISGIGITELLDPFDQQPLRYRPNGEGYLLYSVGEDRIDNGGQRWTARNNGDIVFNCAASEPSS